LTRLSRVFSALLAALEAREITAPRGALRVDAQLGCYRRWMDLIIVKGRDRWRNTQA
jgi:hypothetical protein